MPDRPHAGATPPHRSAPEPREPPPQGIMARSQQLLRSLTQGRQLAHSLDGLEVRDSSWDEYLDCCRSRDDRH